MQSAIYSPANSHDKPRPEHEWFDMWIIGHRGAAGTSPENTFLSIGAALYFGVDWIDFDFLMVSGAIIVFHVEEFRVGDLNGDRDTNDNILHYHDLGTGQTVNTGLDGEFPSVDNGLVPFHVSESRAQLDVNGDGDTFDIVLMIYDIQTGNVSNTEITTDGGSLSIHVQ